MTGTPRMSAQDFVAMQTAKVGTSPTTGSGAKRSKYGAVRTEVDGITFDSKAEAARYQTLRAMEKAGEISSLSRQVSYPLLINGTPCGSYRADFVYRTREGREVVEDVKGFVTPEYRLKKKIVFALYGVQIQEVK